MAFPTIQPIETRQIASSTTHSIVLPSEIVAGELVLIFHSNSSAVPTYPTGWNATPIRATGFCYGALLYAVADGTTAGSTVSITLSSARAGCAQIIRISGWEGTIGSGLTVGTVDPAFDTLDPAAVTASWGSDDNLFICALVAGDDDVAVTGYPTNYTQGAYVNTGAGLNLGAEIATAYRELAAATDNPGSFTLASSESQGAVALVVRPGTAGPASTPEIRKSSTFDIETTLGTITTATLNAVNVFDHITGQAGTTVSFEGAATDEITTSGEYTLTLGDGSSTEDITVQVNIYGVAPSNNPLQKDGSALASLTNVQVRVTDGANINGTELYYSGTATTDASGNLGNIDLSSTAAAVDDSVLFHMRTAAGDSIIAAETVELI